MARQNGGGSDKAAQDNQEPTIKADLIKKLDRDLRPLEKRLADLKGDISDLRSKFRQDTGITMADFDAARRLALMEDDDERHKKMDALLIVYNTLKPGEQLSWLDA